MSIRKLLLPLSSTAGGEAALSTALTVARQWNAHLAVLHVGVDGRREAAVRGMFDRIAREYTVVLADAKPDTNTATASFSAVTGREADTVAQHARLVDLIVVAHPANREDVSSSDALHAVLFDSGRPVIIAPPAPSKAIGSRTCLGWNGSAKSASAMMAGLPWLERAEAVRILWSEEYQRRGPLAPELQSYLAAHGVTADRHMFEPIDNVVGAGLLAAAYEFHCDLLIMGAYSHSRLRQLVLGGVTRHVLEHAAVPVMMHR